MRTSNLQIPTLNQRQILKSFRNDHVEFGHSKLYPDTPVETFPYFDVRPVVTNPPMPLSGIGLHYKASEGSGGFIAPLIYPALPEAQSDSIANIF